MKVNTSVNLEGVMVFLAGSPGMALSTMMMFQTSEGLLLHAFVQNGSNMIANFRQSSHTSTVASYD